MATEDAVITPEERVVQLGARYRDNNAATADLLCDRYPADRVAYSIIDQRLVAQDLTFGDLRRDSESLAAGLARLGLGPGDRIATLMGKSREYLVSVMAIWRLGAVHVPLFTAFAPPAIAFRLSASKCQLVICDEAQEPKLAASDVIPPRPTWKVMTTGERQEGELSLRDTMNGVARGFPAATVGGDGPIIEIYTSGTTGNPKGVVVPLKAVASFQVYAEYGLDLCDADIFWNAADPGWGYGLYFGILAALSTGTHGVLFSGGFSTEATFEILSRFGITNFTAAPTVYRSLRASGLQPSSGLRLRCASSAGEPLTPEVNEWAPAALGVPVRDHYGQTEAGMLVNNHHHRSMCRDLRAGSMGHAMPGWKPGILLQDADELVRPGDFGRLAFDLRESPLAWFSGYVDQPTKTADKFSADGRWYLSGDTARMDDDGYLYFSARDDDIIIMAGYRIGPFEVEAVLSTHPAVKECAVVAIPDSVRGEVLVAAIVLTDGREPNEALTAELQRKVKVDFAAHAYPRQVYYLRSLPKTPSGKIQRFLVRETLRQTARGQDAG